MSAIDGIDSIPLIEIAINDLAFRSLNASGTCSENKREAIDNLAEQIRKGALGITVALLEVAKAIEKTAA